MGINVNNINQQNNYNIGNPKINTEYSSIKMSGTHQGTGSMGLLIPGHVQEMLPSQKISLDLAFAQQYNPLVSQLFHEVNGSILYYFVPNRLMWEEWETFIIGGEDGQDATAHPTIDLKVLYDNAGGIPGCLEHTLADYFGMPINTDFDNVSYDGNIQPSAFPWYGYNLIYNDCIRFPDILDTPVALDNNTVLRGYDDYNYFTRSRIYQMRGVVPSIPISDELQELAHEWSMSNTLDPWDDYTGAGNGINTGGTGGRYLTLTTDDEILSSAGTATSRSYLRVDPHELTALGMNMNDFMVGLGIMRYQINNAKIQPQYVKQLQARFGIFPQDSRLDRPEFIKTDYFNVMCEPVKQTSYGDVLGGETPQGYTTGYMTGGGTNMGCEYEASEHGYLFAIFIIKPKPVYEGGLSRRWIKNNKFDYATPELANLPDREVYTYELMYEGIEANDEVVFGWQGMYEEYRTLVNEVHGLLRPTSPAGMPSYTLAQYWTPGGGAPVLNNDFMSCTPDETRILQYTNQPAFIYFLRISINTAIPLPLQSQPGDLGYL